MKIKRTCKHCPAWEPNGDGFQVKGYPPTEAGRCFLEPPQRIVTRLLDGEWDNWEHPVTLEHDWCFRGQDLEA